MNNLFCYYNSNHSLNILISFFRKMFTILEFEDGISYVPTNWIIDEKKCYWPNTESAAVILKKNPHSRPNQNWKVYDIKRRFCSSRKFRFSKSLIFNYSNCYNVAMLIANLNILLFTKYNNIVEYSFKLKQVHNISR